MLQASTNEAASTANMATRGRGVITRRRWEMVTLADVDGLEPECIYKCVSETRVHGGVHG